MTSRPRTSSVDIRGVGLPPGQQHGVMRRQSPHGQQQQQQRQQQQQQRAPVRASKPDPWLSGTAPATTTVLAMSQNPDRSPDRLSFGCPNLDVAFGGGVCVQGITEIAGEAGAGKTQLCLQLLLQAQLAPEAGGLGGKSYVLTCGEGDFPSRRLRQMAAGYQSRHDVRPEKLMEGVCIQNAKTLDDQMMIIMEHLPHIMKSHNIKLVVIDSIAALFRSDMGRGRSDIGERSRLLGRLSQQMKRLGDRHGAAFVVVNQVTAKFGSSTAGEGAGAQGAGGGRDRGGSGNVPAMGLLWSQCINSRFLVHRRDFRLSLQPSSASSTSNSAAAGSAGGRPTAAPTPPSSSTMAREITLDMSPCVAVHAACGFVIERAGVRGVGR